jgi:hypothetical protein
MTRTTLMLVTIAALVNGLLAGGNLDRLLVATPAWEEVGLNAWADFSRAADLGHGQILYPLLALGSTVLAVVAAVIFVWKRRTPSAALAAIGLSATFMQSLRSIHDGDTAALGRAFAGAHFWGRFQGYFHLAAFCCQLWAIAALARLRSANDQQRIERVEG